MLLLEDLQRPRLSIPRFARQQGLADSSALLRLEHRWNCYLNQLALGALKPWVEEEQGHERAVALSALWQSVPKAGLAESQPWQWVNGSAMVVAGQRWIVIPTDDLDVEQFRVPQEWVDISSWSGDYYLMVQLDPEAGWLQVRGYLNHSQLKEQATYDEGDRTYCINDDALIQDIDLLWVMSELESVDQRQAELAEIPSLSPGQVEPLIQQICQELEQAGPASAKAPLPQTAFSPRLVLSFEQWAGIMENPEFRRSLERAMRASLSANGKVTQLRRWLAGTCEPVWQSLEQLPSLQVSRGLRQMPAQSVSRGKRLSLAGLQSPLTLWTTVTEETTDGRMMVLVQLRHQAEDAEGLVVRPLPKGLKLILLTPSEESLQVVTAREQDDYIQLKRFKVRSGKVFCVEIRLGDQVARERFRA